MLQVKSSDLTTANDSAGYKSTHDPSEIKQKDLDWLLYGIKLIGCVT